MRTALLILIALIAGTAAGWYLRKADEKSVRAAQLFTLTDQLDGKLNFLAASGTWIGADLATKTNTVRIFCNPDEKSCEVTQADVTALMKVPILNLEKSTYGISKIDSGSLVAEAQPGAGCIRQTLLVDRVAKRVSFVRTKIKREPPCDIVQDEPVMLYLGDPK